MSEQTEQRAARTRHVVVVGAGMAGVQSAVALREAGFTGPVTLIGAEPHQPYDRPPLSKAVLLGKAEDSAFDVDFEALDITLRLGLDVTALRAADHVLDTADGPVPYDALVLATGAEPMTLPGAEGVPGVHLLRTLDDAARLRPVLDRQHDVVVVGAGWIGAEFATAARAAGCAVTVVEAAARPLIGTLPAEVAAPMAAWYADSGAELLTGARVDHVEEGAVVLADGRVLPMRRRGRRHRRAPRHPLAGKLRGRARPGRLGHRRQRAAYLAARCVRGRGLRLLPLGPLRDTPAGPPLGQRSPGPAHGRRRDHGHPGRGTAPRLRPRPVLLVRAVRPLRAVQPAITRAPTPWCGAATGRTRPGRCAGCTTALWWPCSPWAARATSPRAAGSSSRGPSSTRRRWPTPAYR